MNVIRSEVRRPEFLVLKLLRHALKLALADLCEVRSVRRACGILIQEDRDAELLADSLSDFLCDCIRLCDRRIAAGDEGNHVNRTHARMLSLVLGHINQLYSNFKRVDDCVAKRFRLADCGNYAAIVVHVCLAIQKANTFSVLEASSNLCHLFHVAPFAVIRHSLKKFLCHLSPPFSYAATVCRHRYYYTRLFRIVRIYFFLKYKTEEEPDIFLAPPQTKRQILC